MHDLRFQDLALWVDPQPRSGPMNMALDHALLDRGKAVLRAYHWAEVTQSLGYRYPEAGNPQLPRVRRWTGGGLVMHDAEETTYSLILPATEPWSQQPASVLYRAVHGGLAAALSKECEFTLAEEPGPEAQACFQGWAQWDILLHGIKVAGAGQRRCRQGLLHQGSLRTPAAKALDWQSLAKRWCPGSRAFEPDAALFAEAELWVRSRYGTAEWFRTAGAVPS
jgi:lipoyl(octanoyl) transferase